MTAQIQYYYIGGLLLGILYSVDCPMSQQMSWHQNTTKNIQQTTHVMTLNATYDIGQFDIIEFKILKKISFHNFSQPREAPKGPTEARLI